MEEIQVAARVCTASHVQHPRCNMHPKYYIQRFHGELPAKLHNTLMGFCKPEPSAIYPLSYSGTLENFLEKWDRPVLIVPKGEKEYGVIYVTQHNSFNPR